LKARVIDRAYSNPYQISNMPLISGGASGGDWPVFQIPFLKNQKASMSLGRHTSRSVEIPGFRSQYCCLLDPVGNTSVHHAE
jgi:hypothetical protein